MSFLISFFFNFFAVFIVNRIIPGIEIGYFENLPNVGADLFFSLVVGFLNASIYPVLASFMQNITLKSIAVVSFIISFGSFILIHYIQFGVRATTAPGIFVGGSLVWAAAVFTNFLFMRRRPQNPEK
ncbi:MAG: hypothetical protein COT84_03795 [Chlamydiae bacterium CG10_big_fil_rev_8_21_14_0_10_35_9]|nr:MAG: hypothetical protein COT84_03795 [Chlamydiae bacterium CG10_big_fil_rev_8_21_14_0_10_35_9]